MGYSYKKVRRSKRNNKFNKRNSKKRNSKRLASKRNKYMRGGMNALEEVVNSQGAADGMPDGINPEQQKQPVGMAQLGEGEDSGKRTTTLLAEKATSPLKTEVDEDGGKADDGLTSDSDEEEAPETDVMNLTEGAAPTDDRQVVAAANTAAGTEAVAAKQLTTVDDVATALTSKEVIRYLLDSNILNVVEGEEADALLTSMTA